MKMLRKLAKLIPSPPWLIPWWIVKKCNELRMVRLFSEKFHKKKIIEKCKYKIDRRSHFFLKVLNLLNLLKKECSPKIDTLSTINKNGRIN